MNPVQIELAQSARATTERVGEQLRLLNMAADPEYLEQKLRLISADLHFAGRQSARAAAEGVRT